jgi:hypothetical protein
VNSKPCALSEQHGCLLKTSGHVLIDAVHHGRPLKGSRKHAPRPMALRVLRTEEFAWGGEFFSASLTE